MAKKHENESRRFTEALLVLVSMSRAAQGVQMGEPITAPAPLQKTKYRPKAILQNCLMLHDARLRRRDLRAAQAASRARRRYQTSMSVKELRVPKAKATSKVREWSSESALCAIVGSAGSPVKNSKA